MRKRSRYRPKPVYQNPVAAVLENIASARSHGTYLLDLKIRNHGAVTSVMRGTGTKEAIRLLMAMSNMVEALLRLGYGREYAYIQQAGYTAVRDLAARFGTTGRAVLRAPEIAAINDLLALHDEQFELVTVQDVDRALVQIRKDGAAGRVERVFCKELTA